MIERRATRRRPLRMTATLRLRTAEGEREFPALLTRDVSPSGVFLFGSPCLPAGAEGDMRLVVRSPLLRRVTGRGRFALRRGIRVVRCATDGWALAFTDEAPATEFAG